MGTSWIKLLNRYKKYRDKSVTTDDNKYSYQPHPCTTTTPYCHSITLLVMITSDIASNCNMIWRDNAELQWCMGVANNYTYILVPVLFTPVQQFHPNCSHTFYTCSTLYLFKFLGKFLCLVNKILVIDSWMQFYIEITIGVDFTKTFHICSIRHLHEVYGHYRWVGSGEESQYYNTTYDQSVVKFTINNKN